MFLSSGCVLITFLTMYIAEGNRPKSQKHMMFLVQAGTFLCFQAGRSSATRSSASDLTVCLSGHPCKIYTGKKNSLLLLLLLLANYIVPFSFCLFSVASISYLDILVKYILAKKNSLLLLLLLLVNYIVPFSFCLFSFLFFFNFFFFLFFFNNGTFLSRLCLLSCLL